MWGLCGSHGMRRLSLSSVAPVVRTPQILALALALCACRRADPAACLVARVGGVDVLEADIKELQSLSQPGLDFGPAQRLALEAAGCVSMQGHRGRIDVPAALACHRAMWLDLRREHPDSLRAAAGAGHERLSSLVPASSVEAGPCADRASWTVPPKAPLP